MNSKQDGGDHRRKPAFARFAWADTTTVHGRLMLTVLGGLVEFERELIRACTGEGRDRGETLSDIARSYNVHPSTISRLTA